MSIPGIYCVQWQDIKSPVRQSSVYQLMNLSPLGTAETAPDSSHEETKALSFGPVQLEDLDGGRPEREEPVSVYH